MSNQNESYTLHFRQTDFCFIFTDIAFRKSNYGKFDYVILQKKDEIAGYLSAEGVQQAHDFGTCLLDKQKADDVLNQLRSFLVDLKEKSIIKQFQSIKSEDLVSQWKLIEAVCDKIGNLYLYCEHPVLAAIEGELIKACPNENDLVKLLKNPEYAESIGLDGQVKEYLERLIEIGELKFKIHSAIEGVFEGLYFFAQHLADKSGYTLDQVLAFRSQEMEDFLLRNVSPDKHIIEERLKGLVFFPKRGEEGTILVGKDYDLWKEKLEPKGMMEVKGTVANRGKATGIVKLHLSLIKGQDMPEGTIIVSGMTNPQMLPFLKKARAIVTDEGGLTCHAAIISRELGIPCVVGTKLATQVFKDGDEIEVDAEKGLVRILKRA